MRHNPLPTLIIAQKQGQNNYCFLKNNLHLIANLWNAARGLG